MDILDIEEVIVKNEKKNILNNAEVNMTVLNSMAILIIFLIVTILILTSKEYTLKL